MPLIYHQNIIPKGEFGVWKLTEIENYFLENIDFEVGELEELGKIKKGRRLEWLAVRWLLHQLSGREVRGEIKKDEYGKPYLVHSDFHISMSHSTKMAAVIAAPTAAPRAGTRPVSNGVLFSAVGICVKVWCVKVWCFA